MDKTIDEIEKEYCVGVVKFFCKQYGSQFKQKSMDPKERTSSIQTLISRQIDSRLCATNIIKNFRVIVTILPEDDRRDLKIDNVFEGKEENTKDMISVSIQFRDFTMVSYEHLI